MARKHKTRTNLVPFLFTLFALAAFFKIRSGRAELNAALALVSLKRICSLEMDRCRVPCAHHGRIPSLDSRAARGWLEYFSREFHPFESQPCGRFEAARDWLNCLPDSQKPSGVDVGFVRGVRDGLRYRLGKTDCAKVATIVGNCIDTIERANGVNRRGS